MAGRGHSIIEGDGFRTRETIISQLKIADP